ncbi:hypothetical protein [Hamadaea tsunoensis]|uniref:hypothetical protein n=1 Tax=Hamadaea tsunoensis TaxID=53368 RepID=UPI000420A434|nr:hypothetical protein [Hamadaea tsunoensis]
MGRVVRISAVVLVLALGAAACGPEAGARPQGRPTTPAASPDAGREALAAQARVLVLDRPADRRPDVLSGPAVQLTQTFGSAAEPYPAGVYDVRVACLGTGSVTVSHPGGETVAKCGDKTPAAATFTMRKTAPIAVTVTPDDAALLHGAYAVSLTDPVLVRARAALSLPPSGRNPLDRSGVLFGRTVLVREKDLGTGSVYVDIRCAGTGRVMIRFGDTDDVCLNGRTTIAMGMLLWKGQGDLVAVPDAEATGAAAYAVAVQRP